jgi:putative hydrolase of the HAD superfamily
MAYTSGLQSWVIFDADNTLWDVETLYNEARDRFCALIMSQVSTPGAKLPAINHSLVDLLQRHRDLQLHATYGYSASRFARSFEDTLLFLFPHVAASVIEEAREIASAVFLADPSLSPHLEVTLLALKAKFSLGIVTAGDRLVQERRIANFKLRHLFTEILIVSKKTSETFEEFCRLHRVGKSVSWVVGDSLKSDIIPATKVGLRAIHFNAPNWTAENGDAPAGVSVAQSMEQVLNLIEHASGVEAWESLS